MKRNLPRRILRFVLGVAVAVVVAVMTGWAALAIYYSDLAGESVRATLAGIFALGTLCAFLFLRNRRLSRFHSPGLEKNQWTEPRTSSSFASAMLCI